MHVYMYVSLMFSYSSGEREMSTRKMGTHASEQKR
jgi:hypothetical protein